MARNQHGIEDEVTHLLESIQQDIDSIKTKFQHLVKQPQDLHILLSALVSHTIDDYHKYRVYFFDFTSPFITHDTFPVELSQIIRVLEVRYIGEIGESTGVSVIEYVKSFGKIVGDIFVQSRSWSNEAKEVIDLCLIGLLKKWTSINQEHWYQQPIALGELLNICHSHLSEFLPGVIHESLRGITNIVLSSTISKDVKQLYLTILQENAQRKVYTDDDHVNDMLSTLGMVELVEVFKSHGIRDKTLFLEWSELKQLLHEIGVKKGQILEIKHYLALRRTSAGVLLPPSAFLQH